MPSKTWNLLHAAADIQNAKMPRDAHGNLRFEWWEPGCHVGQPHNVITLNESRRAPKYCSYDYSVTEYGHYRCTLRGDVMVMTWCDDRNPPHRVRVPATAEAIAAEMAEIQLRDEY